MNLLIERYLFCEMLWIRICFIICIFLNWLCFQELMVSWWSIMAQELLVHVHWLLSHLFHR